MLDELPFESDDGASPRRHRRSRGGRTVFTLFLVVVLLGTLGVAGFYGFDKVKSFFTAADYEGDGNGDSVEVIVDEGDNISTIGRTLHEAGVVKSAQAFIDACADEPGCGGLQPGVYTLQKQMSGEAAVTLILSPGAKGSPELTIPDGLEFWASYETLAASTGIPVADFEAAGADPKALGVPDEWFEREDGQDSAESIEGFLLPDAYTFAADASAEEILAEIVARFLEYTDQIGFVDKVEQLEFDLSPYEALIVASIAEAEAGYSHDLGKISRVFYNRLYGYFECEGCIQSDVTTNYGLMLAGGEKLSSKELKAEILNDPSNEYSTHAHKGLPPGPIDSPGKEALEGVINPPDGNWTYFVAVDKDGTTEFTDDYNVHLQNIELAKENGVL